MPCVLPVCACRPIGRSPDFQSGCCGFESRHALAAQVARGAATSPVKSVRPGGLVGLVGVRGQTRTPPAHTIWNASLRMHTRQIIQGITHTAVRLSAWPARRVATAATSTLVRAGGSAPVSKADGSEFDSRRISPHLGWCAAGRAAGNPTVSQGPTPRKVVGNRLASPAPTVVAAGAAVDGSAQGVARFDSGPRRRR